MTLKGKKIAYDALFKVAGEQLAKHNPCQISKDGKSCNGGKPCCGGCEHLGPTGCTVEALACKVWLCFEVRREAKHQEVVVSLNMLARTGRALGIPMFVRASKEQNFRGEKPHVPTR